jgi:hypothetical protein
MIVEVRDYETHPTHYIVDVILRTRSKNERGTRDVKYKNLRFERHQSQTLKTISFLQQQAQNHHHYLN